MSDEDYFEDDDEEPMQTFLFPIGSIIKRPYYKDEFTVVGYVTYEGSIFHVLLDEYMQEMDQYIEEQYDWKVVGVA